MQTIILGFGIVNHFVITNAISNSMIEGFRLFIRSLFVDVLIVFIFFRFRLRDGLLYFLVI